MTIWVLSISAGVLLVLALVRRIYRSKEFFRRNKLYVDAVLFTGCLLMVGFHFFQTRQKVGMLAVAMGGTAMGKYLFDKRHGSKEEN
jgi:hypothetical protein